MLDLETIFNSSEYKNFDSKGDFSKEQIQNMFLHKIHPRQIVNKISDIPVSFYKVTFKYTTVHGNEKETDRYFLLNTFSPEVNMKKELDDYINKFNNQYPNRKLLNVHFLNSQCLGYLTI